MFLSTLCTLRLLCPSMARTPTFFRSVSVLPALVTVSLECIKIHRCRCSDGFSCVFNRLNLSNKIRPAVAVRGAYEKMFFHAVLARTGNDANFQAIADRLAALSFVDHGLPLESGKSSKELTIQRRTQNLCQLPDHTRFAGRLVLVDQCSPSLKSFSFFVSQDNFQRFPFSEENQCVIEVCCNTLQLSTCPFLESKIQFGTVASSQGRASTDLMVSCTRPR